MTVAVCDVATAAASVRFTVCPSKNGLRASSAARPSFQLAPSSVARLWRGDDGDGRRRAAVAPITAYLQPFEVVGRGGGGAGRGDRLCGGSLFVEEKRATPSQLLRPHHPAKMANEKGASRKSSTT